MHRKYNATLITILTSVLFIIGCSTSSDKHFGNAISDVNVYFKPNTKKIKSAAILPFKAPTALIGNSISDLFVSEFLRMNAFELIERSQMSGVLGEAELSMEGVSDNKAMQVGQMAGADGVIVGTVTEYEMDAYKGKKYPSIGITIRMINCKSGKIIWSADYAERAHEKGLPLSVHARNIVHKITTSLYNGIRKNKADLSEIGISESLTAYPAEDIKISNLGLREVIITWKPVKWNGSYVIERATTPNGPFKRISSVSPSHGKYIDRANKHNNIYDNTTYYYRICPQDPRGSKTTPSAIISSTTAPPPPPVTGIKAESGLVRCIPVKWKQSTAPALVGYIIMRSDSPNGPYKTIKKVKRQTTNWQDGGDEPGNLEDSKTFFYKVFALNKVGAVSQSAESAHATTRNIPLTIKNLQATSESPREIPLSWDISEDEKVIGYIIERATSNEKFKQLKVIKSNTINSWLDKDGAKKGLGDLKDGTTYRYRICAFNIAKANSRWSDIVTAVTKSIPVQPDAPVLSENTPRHINLNWIANPEDDIDKYVIEYRKQGSSSFKKAATINVTMDKMPDKKFTSSVNNLKDGTTYEFRISAIDTDTLQSHWSATAQATTKPIPDPPGNITFRKADSNEIKLNWDSPKQTDIEQYRIYKKTLFSRKLIAETTENNYTLPEEAQLKKWTIEIIAVDTDSLKSKTSVPLRIE